MCAVSDLHLRTNTITGRWRRAKIAIVKFNCTGFDCSKLAMGKCILQFSHSPKWQIKCQDHIFAVHSQLGDLSTSEIALWPIFICRCCDFMSTFEKNHETFLLSFGANDGFCVAFPAAQKNFPSRKLFMKEFASVTL
jgi:hypothetical protein